MIKRIVPVISVTAASFLAGGNLLAQQGPAVDAYPSRTVRLIVASPPGSGADLMMRQLTPLFGQKMGQTFVVDNRPGAAGGLGLDLLSRAAPDGYTLGPLIAQNVAAMVTNTINVNIQTQLAPVAIMVSQPYILLGSPNLPAKTVQELVAYSKGRQLAYASSGIGSVVHLGMELINSKAGISILHVPYKGSADMLTDLMSDRVQTAIINSLSAKPFVTSGKVKALAVTGRERAAIMPDIPTVAESGLAGYELLSWYGMAAPRATPAALIQKLNQSVTGILNAPEVKKKFADEGADVAPPNKPEDLANLVQREKQQWEALVKGGNIKL